MAAHDFAAAAHHLTAEVRSSELIQPKMRTPVPALRLPPFIAPMFFAKRGIGHIRRRRYIRRSRWLRILRSHARPIVVREIVIGVVVIAVQRDILGTGPLSGY